MRLGEIEIIPFEGAENIAQYVAFAASVKGVGSTPEAIEAIGWALGDFTTKEPSVKSVFAPLLGSGAGGIQEELVVNALRTGFTATAAKDASLVIHVLSPDVYERLRGNRRVIQGKSKEYIRVFISHTSKTSDAVEWVKSLALYLMDQGYKPDWIAFICVAGWTFRNGCATNSLSRTKSSSFVTKPTNRKRTADLAALAGKP